MQTSHIKLRLTVMNFLQFAVWGAYLTSMGRYLASAGFAEHIGSFYAMQGIVSLFMPALMGIVADRWVPAQRLLGICHLLAGGLMFGLYFYTQSGSTLDYGTLFALYTLSVAFYMPTLALSNSVAYTSLEQAGMDLVKSFPPIRVFGTVGFICTMISVSLLGVESTSGQFAVSATLGLIQALYSWTLPHCPTAPKGESKGLVEALGLRAFVLFRQRKMALFFVFSMLLGVSLQITNGFANPFINTFGEIPAYAETFGVKYANILISLSQLSETLCILLIPFALRRFGIKNVMLIAMVAWVNVSGSLFVDKETDPSIRSSAQGLFMIMTNGIGATLGSLGAQAVVNHYVYSEHDVHAMLAGWSVSWYIFAAYAAVVALFFALLFRYKGDVAKA